jgi:hypothetical protein
MSTLQVQAELLERRSALDAKCVDLALQFVQNLATAEDLFARAVNRASAILVTGLLETDFGSGAESSRRRAALLAIGKMASVLSAEVGEHANELQTVAAAELTELSAAAAQRTLLLASRRAGRQRDERAALEALGQAKLHRQEMSAAAAAAAGAAAAAAAAAVADSGSGSGGAFAAAGGEVRCAAGAGEACPWLLDVQVQACEQAVHECHMGWVAELGIGWRQLADTECAHTAGCQRALALCSHALRPRLLALTAAAETAAMAVDQLDGAEEWTGFGQAASRSLHSASEPTPPAPPNMAQVVYMGPVARRLPSLLGGGSWAAHLAVLTRAGVLHLFEGDGPYLESAQPQLSLALRGCCLRCTERQDPGALAAHRTAIAAAASIAAASTGGKGPTRGGAWAAAHDDALEDPRVSAGADGEGTEASARLQSRRCHLDGEGTEAASSVPTLELRTPATGRFGGGSIRYVLTAAGAVASAQWVKALAPYVTVEAEAPPAGGGGGGSGARAPSGVDAKLWASYLETVGVSGCAPVTAPLPVKGPSASGGQAEDVDTAGSVAADTAGSVAVDATDAAVAAEAIDDTDEVLRSSVDIL